MFEANGRDRALAALATKQYGTVTRRQLKAIGFPDRTISHLTRRGVLERVHPGVLAVAGSVESWHRSMMAACLWGGRQSFASHRSAARLLGLDGSAEAPIVEITIVGTAARSRPAITIHRTRDPLNGQTRHVAHIPCTEITRTLVNLAAGGDEETTELALDDAFRRGLISLDYMSRRLTKVGGQGRPGTRVLRTLLEERMAGAESDSGFEIKIKRALNAHGFHPPRSLYNAFDEGVLLGEIDFAWPRQKVGIECDSRRFHTGKRFFIDLARRNRFVAAGWTILHATWRDLEDGGRKLAGELHAALGQAKLPL